LANRLTIANFTQTSRKNITYQGKNNTFKINLANKACLNGFCCSCGSFMKNAVCMHLVGFSNLFQKNLFGEKWLNEPTEFNHAKKRGQARKVNRYGPVVP